MSAAPEAPVVFVCRMCGHCCEGTGGIVLAARDRVRLAGHLGLPEAAMVERYAETVGGKVRLRCGADGFCVFYSRERGCAVHAGRPDICRAWPFFRGNLVDRSSWEMIQDDCPGVCAPAGHAEFRRQGLVYVRTLGVDEPDEGAPGALLNLPD